ncbi:hypothetical protein, partial [Bacillus pumilus]|uniref:hypothetical protein n=1 Tax=Bacillus pumilus TaxID=1408 RepID=UPI00227EC9AC
ERSEFDIREHRSADLTTNAKVCLHAEAPFLGAFYCSQLINTSLLIKTRIRGNINIHTSKKKGERT